MNVLYENDAIDFNQLFPFFFEMDHTLCIRKAGRSLIKLIPSLETPQPFEACFSIQRPWSMKLSFLGFAEFSAHLFILRIQNQQLTLRGQVILLEHKQALLFLGTPWFTEVAQLTTNSLVLQDFVLSDSFTDTLQLLQINEINNREIRLLLDNLNQQKKRLEEKEYSYRQLVENATDLICRCDAEGRISYINPAAYEITGYTVDEIVGHKIYNLVSPDFREEVKAAILEQAYNKVQYSNYDYIVFHKKGYPVWFSQNTIAVFENDQLVGFTCIARDITYKKEIEKELVRSRKEALELVVTRERFLANTSHEIRTPMNAIIGISNLLKETNLTDKQREYVHSIHTSSENLLVIINDILDLSKIEAGKLTLENIDFDLKEKLSTLVRSLQLKASEKSLYLSLAIDTGVGTWVKGDPYRLNQVLMNLLSNALKFTDQGSVALKLSVIKDTPTHQTLAFVVEDTGIGISDDKLESIFDDFTQADTSTTRKYGGTGLGLSISRKMAQLMQGTLSVKSKPAVGSTFTLKITVEKGKKQIEAKQTLHKTHPDLLQGKTVLLVEDNEFNQLLAATILEQWNTKVTLAQNGQEAIDKVKLQEFDVILMDIQMPVMGGIEATQIIRNELQLHTPIIALTANAISGNIQEYTANGMNACVTKPFQREALFETIYEVISQTKALS